MPAVCKLSLSLHCCVCNVPILPSERRGPSRCCSCAETFPGLSLDSETQADRRSIRPLNQRLLGKCVKWWPHQALAAHHLQQVQQSGAITEVTEQIQDHARRPPLSQHTQRCNHHTIKIQLGNNYVHNKQPLLRCFCPEVPI